MAPSDEDPKIEDSDDDDVEEEEVTDLSNR